MTPPTQEKTMEKYKDNWEIQLLELLIDINDADDSVDSVLKMNFKGDKWVSPRLISYISDLLASSQDSFRRKVEEELLRDEREQFRTPDGDILTDWKAQNRNRVRAEQRAKLKTLK